MIISPAIAAIAYGIGVLVLAVYFCFQCYILINLLVTP